MTGTEFMERLRKLLDQVTVAQQIASEATERAARIRRKYARDAAKAIREGGSAPREPAELMQAEIEVWSLQMLFSAVLNEGVAAILASGPPTDDKNGKAPRREGNPADLPAAFAPKAGPPTAPARP